MPDIDKTKKAQPPVEDELDAFGLDDLDETDDADTDDSAGKALGDDELDEMDDMDAEEADSEDEESEDTLDDDEQEEDTEPKAKPSTLSKADKALVRYKKQATAAERKAKELEDKLSKYESAERKEKLRAQLEDEGYDPETASRLAEAEAERDTTRRLLEDTKFLMQNQAVLMRYPDASANLDRIREAMKATGKSLPEVCAFLFSKDSRFDAKAKADMLAGARGHKAAGAATAVSAEAEPEDESLTQNQEYYRRHFERMLGRKLSGKETKEILSRSGGRKGRQYEIL